MKCNCENNLCGTHPAGACKTPAGKARAMYVGSVCDDCAGALNQIYILNDKNGSERKRNFGRPELVGRPIGWRNFDAYNGVDDR